MSETRQKRKIEFIESYWTGGEYGSDYVWNDNHGELVRCRDCKNSQTDRCRCLGGIDSYYWCSYHAEWREGDWFCADGEREEKE